MAGRPYCAGIRRRQSRSNPAVTAPPPERRSIMRIDLPRAIPLAIAVGLAATLVVGPGRSVRAHDDDVAADSARTGRSRRLRLRHRRHDPRRPPRWPAPRRRHDSLRRPRRPQSGGLRDHQRRPGWDRLEARQRQLRSRLRTAPARRRSASPTAARRFISVSSWSAVAGRSAPSSKAAPPAAPGSRCRVAERVAPYTSRYAMPP